MYPLKFKAWNLRDQVMCDVYSISYLVGGIFVEGPACSTIKGWAHVHPGFGDLEKTVELLPFTGKYDRKVQEIYLHDIIEMGGFLYTVQWDERAAKFYLKSTNALDNVKWGMTHLTRPGDKIGNMYENPELLCP